MKAVLLLLFVNCLNGFASENLDIVEPFFLERPDKAITKIIANTDNYADILQSEKGYFKKKQSDCLGLSGRFMTYLDGVKNDDLTKIEIIDDCKLDNLRIKIKYGDQELLFLFNSNQIFLNPKKSRILLKNEAISIKGNIWKKGSRWHGLANFFGYSKGKYTFGSMLLYDDLDL